MKAYKIKCYEEEAGSQRKTVKAENIDEAFNIACEKFDIDKQGYLEFFLSTERYMEFTDGEARFEIEEVNIQKVIKKKKKEIEFLNEV